MQQEKTLLLLTLPLRTGMLGFYPREEREHPGHHFKMNGYVENLMVWLKSQGSRRLFFGSERRLMST